MIPAFQLQPSAGCPLGPGAIGADQRTDACNQGRSLDCCCAHPAAQHSAPGASLPQLRFDTVASAEAWEPSWGIWQEGRTYQETAGHHQCPLCQGGLLMLSCRAGQSLHQEWQTCLWRQLVYCHACHASFVLHGARHIVSIPWQVMGIRLGYGAQ